MIKGQAIFWATEIIRANKMEPKSTHSGGYILVVETYNKQDK